MKKKLLAFIILGFFFSNASAQISKDREIRPITLISKDYPLITQVNDSTVRVSQNAIVPVNQVYYVYDNNKKLIATFKSGERIVFAKGKTKLFSAGWCPDWNGIESNKDGACIFKSY